MYRKVKILVSIVLVVFLLSLSGCYWMGKTTGKAVHNVERGGENFESGYNNNR